MTLRYTVGQKYVFIREHFLTDFDNLSLFPGWKPTIDTLLGMDFVVVTCTEHHKVTTGWVAGEEPTHDGFVFVDSSGGVWHVNYPHAGASQTSTFEHVLKPTTVEQMSVCDKILSLISDPRQRRLCDFRRFVELVSYIENIRRGLRHNRRGDTIFGEDLPPDMHNALKKHLGWIVDTAKAADISIDMIYETFRDPENPAIFGSATVVVGDAATSTTVLV